MSGQMIQIISHGNERWFLTDYVQCWCVFSELVTVSLVAVVVCDVAVRDKMQLNSVWNSVQLLLGDKSEPPVKKRPYSSVWFVPELMHIVAMCEERLPLVELGDEVCDVCSVLWVCCSSVRVGRSLWISELLSAVIVVDVQSSAYSRCIFKCWLCESVSWDSVYKTTPLYYCRLLSVLCIVWCQRWCMFGVIDW